MIESDIMMEYLDEVYSINGISFFHNLIELRVLSLCSFLGAVRKGHQLIRAADPMFMNSIGI